MSLGAILFWLVGAFAAFWLAMGMINVAARWRTPAALAVAVLWQPLMVVVLIFLTMDVAELAWRRARRRWALRRRG